MLPLLLPSHYMLLYFLLLNPKPRPGSIPKPSLRVCHPPPPAHSFLLASWSLKRDTLREMVTCVVTETICRTRSFTIPFLAIDPPSLPPTTLLQPASR